MPAFLNLHSFEAYRANGYVHSKDDAVKEDVGLVIHEFEEIINLLSVGVF